MSTAKSGVKSGGGLVVLREREPRLGRNICHLFADCRILSGRAYDRVRVPADDDLIPTCNGCKSGSSVPGLADFG